MRLFWSIGLLFLAACTTDLRPIEGTTTRVGKRMEGKAELSIHIFEDRAECMGRDDDVAKDDAWICNPYVDRSSGQVRYAFQPRLGGETTWPMTLSEEDLVATHNLQRMDRSKYKVTGHTPVATRQLFILLIDVSGSMARQDTEGGPTRMDKVRAALLRGDVIDSFFPGEPATAVAPFIFSSGDPQQLGDQLVLTNKEDYKKAISRLGVGSGYTHLYNGVRYVSTTLIAKPEIQQLIQGQNGMSPTIIALTDGFNNEDDLRGDRRSGGRDLCRDNAPRLERLLQDIQKMQTGGSVRGRPTIFTVGLGRNARPNAKVPTLSDGADVLTSVSPGQLCGQFADMQIDGNVENYGVDNAAMAWIANVGRGHSYVRNDTKGLAEAFKNAAAKRFKWFDIRYRIGSYYLRRNFTTRLSFVWGGKDDYGSLMLYPSAWLDAPAGLQEEGDWVKAAPFRRTMVFMLPTLGFLVVLGYLPSALFNLKRVFFSRVRRKGKR